MQFRSWEDLEHPSRVMKYTLVLAAAWTLAVGVSLTWNYFHEQDGAHTAAIISARTQFAKDIIYQRWNAHHGGVYVPISESTPPNPYLTDIEEREIVTPSGKRLTLINPAYMIRQVHELGWETEDVGGHITSLNPIRPANAADPWEKHALESFERGEREFASVEPLDDEAHFRLMRPLITEKECLKCHAKQGYKEGDLRGGLSVSIPMAPYMAIAREQVTSEVLGHGALWLLGLAMLAFGARRIQQRERENKKAEEALLKSEEKYRDLVEKAGIGILIDDSAGDLIYFNDTFASIFGYTREEMGKLTFNSLVHPEFLERGRAEHYKRYHQGESTSRYEFEGIRKDGTLLYLEVEMVVLKERNNVTGWRSYVRDITERKKTEDAIRESNIKLQVLYDSSSDSIMLLDEKGFVDCNDATLRLFGCATKEEFCSRHPADFSPPTQLDSIDSMSYAKNNIALALKEGSARFEHLHRRLDGTNFPAQVLLDKMVLNGKEVLQARVYDITERKRVEELLQRHAFQQAEIAKFGESAILISSLDELFEKAVALISRVLGTKYAKVLEHRPEQGVLFLCAGVGWKEGWVGHKSVPDGPGSQGGYTLLQTKPVIAEDIYNETRFSPPALLIEHNVVGGMTVMIPGPERPFGVLGVHTDRMQCFSADDTHFMESIANILAAALQQRQAEDALRESEERFRAIFETAEDSIFIKDCNFRYVQANPAMENLFGMSVSEIIGKTDDELFGEEAGTHTREVDTRVLNGDILREEHTKSVNDTSVTFNVVKVPMRDVDGNIIGLCGIARDITETKRLQTLESRAERLETAGTIAGQVAHDFNNLLSPIMVYPEFIREEIPHDHKVHAYLDDIESAAQKIANINQDLLTMGRRGHYNQKALDLNLIVLHTAKEMESRANTVTCELDLCEDLMNIKGGGAQIHRMLTNLLVNAQDAMEDIGQIIIKTENYYADDTSIAYGRVPKGEYVKLTISDTGCGIPDNIIQKILDPFFSTKSANKKRGSGLGLSVVDAVIKDHNGYLDLSSKVGHGTSFYLYFPVTRESTGEDESEHLTGGTEKVLIVDDDDIQRNVSSQLLKRLGYKVSSVESGERAIEFLQVNPQDLVILDMVMPGGIDGTETYRRIVEISPYQKAIILSGFSETDRVIEVQKLGAGAFVRKPMTRKIIAAAVRIELDRQVKVPVS